VADWWIAATFSIFFFFLGLFSVFDFVAEWRKDHQQRYNYHSLY
jgi:hypothetical protein